MNSNDNQSLLAMSESGIKQNDSKEFPTKRPWIEGAGPIADTAARRISCDASVINMIMQDGEPLNVGRKNRIWPIAICLCHWHQVLVHEGGYRIDRNTIATNNDSSSKDFGLTIGLVSPIKKTLLPTRHRFRFVKAGQSQKERSEHEHQYEHICKNGHSYERKNEQCCEVPAAYRLKNTSLSSHRPSL